ncbi:amidase [Crossiella equi]|uniref:Amidase n=1 Tax=Crossiella equi TaxID=130796 RepID=A0ABS5AA15_9PSEU|nr:amidase [Crossiella equi]MBP2473136.1 amidase [Crossiella equi]
MTVRSVTALGVALAVLVASCGHPESGQAPPPPFTLQEASIADVARALGSGALTSVELTALYLNRIQAYDANGIKLNSVVVPNPEALAEAAASDARRAAGKALGPLDGVPYTVKDSYMVKGLTVASGSPAFAGLTAGSDAFTVRKLREAGGVLLGKTNMPPMAAGGMQRGLYGRPESPYNREYLAAAWGSGSSNGSAVATAANIGVFGMGEETVSSGRSPASNNALVNYTPSRGLLSIRGNWPLWPISDVISPHTRRVEDLLTLLNTIAVKDPTTANDFWRDQRAVTLPQVDQVRPGDYLSLRDSQALKGVRLGVPRMYVGDDLGGNNPIETRPSIRALWLKAADDLRRLGAEVVPVDFPVMYNQEWDRVGAVSPHERGLMPPNSFQVTDKVNAYGAEKFLQSVGDPKLRSWSQVDIGKVFPNPPGSLAEKEGLVEAPFFRDFAKVIAAGVPEKWEDVPGLAETLKGLEQTRKTDFEDWLRGKGLAGVVFPANSEIGRANSDVDKAENTHAHRNGARFSNMNLAMRLLGIPSVSVPMGLMEDTRMPVNLTFAGPAYQDNKLLSFAHAYEQGTRHRVAPSRTAPLVDETVALAGSQFPAPDKRPEQEAPRAELTAAVQGKTIKLSGTSADPSGIAWARVYLNGERLTTTGGDAAWSAEVPVAKYTAPGAFKADSLLAVVVVKDRHGNTTVKTSLVRLG